METFAVTRRPAIVNGEAASNARDLRNFGLIVAALFAAIFGLFFPLLHHKSVPYWPWAIAGTLTATALIRPALLYYFNAAWNALGKVLGWINTRLILGLLFYAVVTPMGLLLRLVSRSNADRSDPSGQASYRVQSRDIARTGFERPF
jgi:Saxitoxin biosynthesis operon protein SxtJ